MRPVSCLLAALLCSFTLSCGSLSNGPCKTDADCKVVDDTCDTCSCLGALAKDEAPTCGTPKCTPAQSLCAASRAVCLNSLCSAVPK